MRCWPGLLVAEGKRGVTPENGTKRHQTARNGRDLRRAGRTTLKHMRPTLDDYMADRLDAGQELHMDERLTSANGQFALVLQTDGNLVLSEGGEAVWASGTDGREVTNVIMQEDGNLVLYAANGEPVWASQTDGTNGAYLLLQDDRNLVIYSADGNPIWATNTLT